MVATSLLLILLTIEQSRRPSSYKAIKGRAKSSCEVISGGVKIAAITTAITTM